MVVVVAVATIVVVVLVVLVVEFKQPFIQSKNDRN